MAPSPVGDSKSPQALLHALCSKITGLKDDSLAPYYKIAMTTLGSSIAIPIESDEFQVAEKIKKKLVRHKRERDAAVFSEYHRKLQAQGLLKHRRSVLYLLHRLSEDSPASGRTKRPPAFIQGLAGHAMSTPYIGSKGYMTTSAPSSGLSSGLGSGLHTTGSSGISSGMSTIHGSTGSYNLPQSYAKTPYTPHTAGGQTGLRLMGSLDRHQTPGSHTTVVVRDTRSGTGYNQTYGHDQGSRDNTSYEVPEMELLREIIYIFQGIDGRYIKIDKDSAKIDTKAGIPKAVRKGIMKLAECGWLYNKIRRYADSRSTDRAFGLVGQSFCAALHQQLTEYHRLVAVLEAQIIQEEDLGVSACQGALSLRRIMVWTFEPLVKLKALAALVDVCQGKKGGALASAIHSYIQHGDPAIRALVKHALTLVAQPIFTTVMRWLYDGELEDTYHEFFVASDPTVKDDRLWHDKYSLRKSMIPSFLTMDQSKKILLTGKSINFLRQVCQDRTTIRNRDIVKAAETHQVESIFSSDLDGVFQKMIDTVYKETSQHLLHVLHTKYKFMDHLKAMRRYLLLGQGDFIRHLMDLLEEDLAKPAGTLFLHNLTGILETAIRATNAQYDDVDILKRVDVRLLEVSPGDTGWDVFSLDYHVDGPIRTVFTPESMIMYLRVFNFLWRAKRMEYILAGVWKGQMANARFLRAIPELGPVQHQCHVVAGEMVHFVQQVQYYINFEVLECSWDELLKKVREAEDLDNIIEAHQNFLTTIITRSLLDTQSSIILTQLRTMFDLIIQFQTIQDNMYAMSEEELSLRNAYEQRQRAKTGKGEWAVREGDEEEEMARRSEFVNTMVPTTRSQLRVLHQSYQNMVQQFLLMLTSHSDVSLRFLSFRLDFNEHYKDKMPKHRSPSVNNKAKRRP